MQNLDRLYGIKNPTVALQWVRGHVGDATIFCGGTMATSSRGVSYYSEGNTSEGNAGCPTTLLNVTIPKGHCTEGTSQALMRCCGEFGPALRPLLCDPAAAATCGLPSKFASRACHFVASSLIGAWCCLRNSCCCTEQPCAAVVCAAAVQLAVPGCLMASGCESSCIQALMSAMRYLHCR